MNRLCLIIRSAYTVMKVVKTLSGSISPKKRKKDKNYTEQTTVCVIFVFCDYLSMAVRIHSVEQNVLAVLPDETVTASRDETKAPQAAHRTISAFAIGRPLTSSRRC